MSTTEDRLLTPAEVGDRLGLANQTLTNWRYRRQGPAWIKISGEHGKPGGEIRYPESALNAWLAGRAGAAVPVDAPAASVDAPVTGVSA